MAVLLLGALLLVGACAGIGGSDSARTGVVPGEITVVRGDTLYAIAERYNVPLQALITLNGLSSPYLIFPGDRLLLPARVTHVVSRGETLYEVSRIYGVDTRELANANDLGSPYTLSVGQILVIPSADTVSSAASGIADLPLPRRKPEHSVAVIVDDVSTVNENRASATIERDRQTSVETPQVDTQTVAPDRPVVAATVTEATVPIESAVSSLPRRKPIRPGGRPQQTVTGPPPLTASGFLWPVDGTVISAFGPKDNGLHNDGINIAAPRGTPVRAAEGGVVVYAGDELEGFGNLLLIRHADGWLSAYAHLDRILVERGATIRRGQTIGAVGLTGSVNRPQLHFELRRGSRALDPIDHLAKRSSPA